MHRLFFRLMVVVALAATVFVFGACGDPEDPQQIGDDCEVDEDCDEGEVCDEEEGECVPVEIDEPCEEDSDCPFSAQICDDGECEFVSRQCSSVGEECEPGEPTASGFACEDLGMGTRCYETCSTARVCIGGEAGEEHYCNRHEACIVNDVSVPVCQASDCEDYYDTEAGCEEMRNYAKETEEPILEHGEHCVEAADDVFVCQPAGPGESGDACDTTSDCGEGLACINELPQSGYTLGPEELPFPAELDEGFCAPVCEDDEACGDDNACIGADHGVAEGLGFCGDRCEPFGTDEQRCDEDTACVPVSGQDGLCHRDTTREYDYYETCDDTEGCPDSAHCLDLGAGMGSRCLPLCDPTLEDDDAQAATCPGPNENRQLGGDCLDIAPQLGEATAVGTGLCIEACRESEDWGVDGCSGEDMACEPMGGGIGWCMEAGDAQRGETCGPDNECAGGLHCDVTGTGEGVCRSYCQPEESTTDDMNCEEDEICVPREGYDNLGECRIPCEANEDGIDPDCPPNQLSCRGEGDKSYCAGSGDLTLGDDCGTPAVQDCVPGLVCAVSGETLEGVLTEPFSDIDPDDEDEDRTATCRQTCEPFVDEFGDSGCPSGYACSPVTPEGESRTEGHCVPAMEVSANPLDPCPSEEVGSMCGENSFCIRQQTSQCGPESTQCIQFCDYLSGAGCSGATECEAPFEGGPLRGFLGICLSS